MKTKKGFELRTVCGERLLLATGEENIDFTDIISLNETAAFLWEQATAAEQFSIEDMIKWLTDEYDVDESLALNDCRQLVKQWMEAGMLEGE